MEAKRNKKERFKLFWNILFPLFILFTFQTAHANAEDPNSPENLLKEKWVAVTSILQNNDIDKKEKVKKVDKIISPIFDFPLMGKLSLGRENWSELSPTQREEFLKLFVTRLKYTYRRKILLYKDEKAYFKQVVQKKKRAYLPMELISKEKKISILYKFHKLKKKWKVYDVEIEGVSILMTLRSQFNDILKHGNIKELLAELRKKLED